MDAGFFKGTTTDQDNRFVDKNKKLMKTMKFGEGLDKKVDMSRVDMEIIRPWINKTITDYLGDEDDVLFEFICNQLDDPLPDGRQMQLNVTGFLGAKNAREFVQKLWQLLASAMDDICGIPEELKEQKKEQIRIKQEEQGRINETIKTHQSMIQEAIAKIKVNAAAAAINNRTLGEHLEKPSLRGRLTTGLSRSRSPRNAKLAGKGAKDSEAGNTQPKASDRSEEPGEVKPGGQKKSSMDDDRRRKQNSYGRNRIRNPSPRRDRRRSREHSPYRKSSPRRRSRSHDSTRRALSRRRSPSPRHSKASPSRHRSHLSRQQRSLSSGRRGPHLSRHRPSHDDNQRRALPDVKADTPSKRSEGRSESSGSQRPRHERSRSRSSSAENVRDGKTSEKPSSIFHHRNYRSHGGGGRRSSPEDAGASPKVTNPRGSRNGHKKSFSPAAAARNDFSPKRKRSPRYSSSVAHRDCAPSPRQSQPPEGDSYPKLDPVYSSRRLSPHLSHSRSQRRSVSFSPGRRAKSQQWVGERRRVSPQSSRYDYNKMPPHLGEGPPQSSIRRNRNVSSGYHGDWGPTSKWDGNESRQRTPIALSEFERRGRSPLIERKRLSPFSDRFLGQHEVRWPSSPRQDPRGIGGEFRAHAGAPRYEQPRGGANAFNRGISHPRQRHGNSPFRRTVPYESNVREPVVEYFADLLPSRGVPPGLGPLSPLMDRHSHAYVRTSGPQRRDDHEPRGVYRGEKYPMRSLEDNYDAPGNKFDPRFERRGNSYDRMRDGYEPRAERFDPHTVGQASDVRARKHLRDKGDYNSRSGNYDSPREDRSVAPRFDRVEDSRSYLNIRSRSQSSQRSKSQKRSRSSSGPSSPTAPKAPQWTNRKAWKEEIVGDRDRHRGAVALRTAPSTNKERTEKESLDYKAKYRHAQRREGSRSLKRGRSTTSSSPDGVSQSSNRERSISGGDDRQEASIERYNDHGKEDGKRNERQANRSLSPSSPSTKRKRVDDEEEVISAEDSEVEVSSKKKKKKKEKKKKRKKHKKHKKHKHKRSQEDENEDDSNTEDHETQDDEPSRSPESRSNILDEEREFELREKAILSLKTSK